MRCVLLMLTGRNSAGTARNGPHACRAVFTFSHQALTQLFEDIGPIRRAFVVQNADGGSKGFGYVHL